MLLQASIDASLRDASIDATIALIDDSRKSSTFGSIISNRDEFDSSFRAFGQIMSPAHIWKSILTKIYDFMGSKKRDLLPGFNKI